MSCSLCEKPPLTAARFCTACGGRLPDSSRVGGYRPDYGVEPDMGSALGAAAEEAFSKAIDLHEYGRWEEALTEYTRAIHCFPSFLDALANRAFVFERLGKHDRAREDYTSILLLRPRDVDIYISRAVAALAMGDTDAAMADYNTVLRIDPVHVAAYRERAIAWLEQKDFDRALDDLLSVIDLADPPLPSHFLERSLAYTGLARYEEALSDLNQALSMDPEYVDAMYERGMVLTDIQEWQDAIEDFSKALELKPDNDAAYRERGRAFYGMGELELARDDFAAALECDNSVSANHFYLGLVLLDLGDALGAVSAFDRSLDLAPDNPDTLRERGSAFFQAGQFDEARKDLVAAFELAPDHPESHFRIGLIFLNDEDPENAIPWFDNAIAIDPEISDYYEFKGDALKALGKCSMAAEEYRWAINIGPTSPSVQYRLREKLRAVS